MPWSYLQNLRLDGSEIFEKWQRTDKHWKWYATESSKILFSVVLLKLMHIPKGKIIKKPVAVSASMQIHNAQTKGIQQKSVVKPVLKAEGCTSIHT